MTFRTTGTALATTELASTLRTSIDLQESVSAAIQVVYEDAAPAAVTFDGSDAQIVDVDANTIVSEAHGYVTGLKVAATTAGTLPTGLSATDYYVIKVDADTLKLATSLANAVAGTAVNITAVGVGNSTLTPATSAGNVAKLQESVDGTNWTDVSGKTVTISTSAGNALWEYTGSSRYLAVLYTPSAGQVSLAVKVSLVR
jgi:hypothetical protein